MMLFSFRIHPHATAEISQIASYYHQINATLSSALLTEVEACIQRVCHFPGIYQMVCTPYRRALIHCFPYALLYRLEAQVVYIDGVFSTKANPEHLERILQERLH